MREAVVGLDDGGLAALGIEELVSACRDAGLRGFEELTCQGDGAVVQVRVAAPLDEWLRELEYVESLERVPTSDDTHLYVIAFTSPGLSGDVTEHADRLVGDCDPEVGERGATVSFVGPQEAIRGTVSEYEDAGTAPTLRKLGGYDGGERPLDGLTDRQREVIRTAHEMGYYEVPREASTDDVAAAVGVDPSTVAEHLQRAERNLLDRLLAE